MLPITLAETLNSSEFCEDSELWNDCEADTHVNYDKNYQKNTLKPD